MNDNKCLFRRGLVDARTMGRVVKTVVSIPQEWGCRKWWLAGSGQEYLRPKVKIQRVPQPRRADRGTNQGSLSNTRRPLVVTRRLVSVVSTPWYHGCTILLVMVYKRTYGIRYDIQEFQVAELLRSQERSLLPPDTNPNQEAEVRHSSVVLISKQDYLGTP